MKDAELVEVEEIIKVSDIFDNGSICLEYSVYTRKDIKIRPSMICTKQKIVIKMATQGSRRTTTINFFNDSVTVTRYADNKKTLAAFKYTMACGSTIITEKDLE